MGSWTRFIFMVAAATEGSKQLMNSPSFIIRRRYFVEPSHVTRECHGVQRWDESQCPQIDRNRKSSPVFPAPQASNIYSVSREEEEDIFIDTMYSIRVYVSNCQLWQCPKPNDLQFKYLPAKWRTIPSIGLQKFGLLALFVFLLQKIQTSNQILLESSSEEYIAHQCSRNHLTVIR